jgi:UDP-N-acetylmuramoyl-tripeptide--D-alanyl-D-alanine ligase
VERVKQLIISLFLAYLRLAAQIQLKKIHPWIVGLTGSVGKTSLRNAIVAVLASKYRVKYSKKANSEIGIPLDLLDLHVRDYRFWDWLRLGLLVPINLLTNWRRYDVYVVELGIDDPFEPKNMGYLLRFIKPDIGVFLNVAPVHAEQFGKVLPTGKSLSDKQKEQLILEAIAWEKGKLITQLPAGKIAVVNRDDSLVWRQAKKTKAKVVAFGKLAKGGVAVGKLTYQFAAKKHLTPQAIQTHVTFTHRHQTYVLSLPLLVPEYYASTLAAALAVGVQMGIGVEKGLVSLGERFVLPPGRLNCFAGIRDSLLIDSSYNASKSSTLGALDLLKQVPQSPKVVVLGDMQELGELAETEHRSVAKAILDVADQVVLVGPLAQAYVLPLVVQKLPTRWFPNSWEAATWLSKNLRTGSVVLVKGSQNTIYTEIVVEQLLANSQDKSRLCRRSPYWERQRQSLKAKTY